MTSIFNVVRTVTIVIVCGLSVAGTSRGMHNEPVSPYYAQLAAQTVKALNDTKQAILRGHDYVGDASK